MRETLDQLVRALVASGGRSIRPAARLMTLLEDEPERLPELFRAVSAMGGLEAGGRGTAALSRLQPRLLVGVTGAPGSGKSTLVDALIREYRRRWPDRRLGVIAVDPSSPFTGGAVLGDRVRMMRHATDPMVFVRSVASRGHLGGLSLGVKGIVHVLGLAGCDAVFLETVGVGQSEVEVARVADLVLIVLAPGQGDSVQLLKAGLMEVGDLFVVNKADRPDAERLLGQLLATLRLDDLSDDEGHHAPGADDPSARVAGQPHPADAGENVLLASAADGRGVGAIVDRVEALALRDRDRWLARREAAIATEVREAVIEAATRRIEEVLGDETAARQLAGRVIDGAATIEEVADRLICRAAKSGT